VNIALIAISSLSLVASSATLVVVLVGAKRMQAKGKEMERQVVDARKTANRSVTKLREALAALEI